MAPTSSTALDQAVTLAPQSQQRKGRPLASPARFRIRTFTREDKLEVWRIFEEVTMQFQPSIDEDPEFHARFATYPQRCFNRDLGDIEDTYMARGGHFWVVTAIDADSASGQREQIVGIVGLENKGDGLGELRRLAVDERFRRHGLGERLVRHVEQWATAQGFTAIRFNSDCVMTAAHRLYDRLGYTRTHIETERAEPHYFLIWFRKSLTEA